MGEKAEVKRAVLGIVYGMVFVDGKFTDSERAWLVNIVTGHPIFDGTSEDDMIAMSTSVLDEASQVSLPRAVEIWGKQIPGHLRLDVFELAVRGMLADSEVAKNEVSMTMHLGQILGVTESEVRAIVTKVRGY